MKSDISFVKHGELVNFLYQALGILPRKKAKTDAFDEEQKKSNSYNNRKSTLRNKDVKNNFTGKRD